MRSIIIKNIEYKTFEEIRNTLYRDISFAIISNSYLNRTGYIQFWDESWIPKSLRPFIVSPVSETLLEKLDKDLKPFIDLLQK